MVNEMERAENKKWNEILVRGRDIDILEGAKIKNDR